MYRGIIACIVIALMAQAGWAEGYTVSSGMDCTPKKDYTVAPAVVENNETFHFVVIHLSSVKDFLEI